jgi:hypothetical protein
MFLRRADHSSREVLPSVVCLSDCELSKMMRPWFNQEVAPWLKNLDFQSNNDPGAVTYCILPSVEYIPSSTLGRLIHSPKHVAELICTNNL